MKVGELVMDQIKLLAKWIKESKKVAYFSGAGISTASGIPDFRSSGGVWKEDVNREYYISRSFYNRKPKEFWKRYKEIFQVKLAGNYEPNEGHLFIAELEKLGKEVTVLTQNIDGLHQKAGSTNVIELHGTLKTATCPKCKTVYDLEYINENKIPRCSRETMKGICNFILKPDVVLFGDAVKGYKLAEEALEQADVFIVMGTSLQVYPVNMLPRHFVYVMNDWEENKEPKMAIINRDETEKDEMFQVVIHADIVDTVRELKKELNRIE